MEQKGADHHRQIMFGRASTGRNRLTAQLRTPRKNQFHVVPTPAKFAFQRRVARIDWRILQSIDIDQVIREVDIGALESVLDTVVFGDIQGEDTRNFTEANFVKIFRLAQLLVEYLLHVQNLLSDHKSGLLRSKESMEQKNENIRSRFLCQRDALLQTRYELKQTKKTLKAYEVMMKKNNQTSQSDKRQVWHCALCAKAFTSSYFLDMHVARKHYNKQDEIMIPIAEEAHVKAEKSAEIQQLREQYQEDLQRAETNSKTQVRSLQEDLRQSNSQLQEAQTRLEDLQAQIDSASPESAEHVVEIPEEERCDPEQERLYELESKYFGLEHKVKTLGQENSKLHKELNMAYADVSDLQFAKRQSAFALEAQIDDLRKENQHLRKTMSQVNSIAVQAAILDDRPDETKSSPNDLKSSPDEMKSSPDELKFSPGNSSGACSWRMHPPPKPPQTELVEETEPVEESEPVEVPVQEGTNAVLPVQAYHNIPEPILSIIEAKEPPTQVCHMPEPITADVQSSNILNNSSFSPVLEKSPEISSPLQLLNFSGRGILDISPSRGSPELSSPLQLLNFSRGGILDISPSRKRPGISLPLQPGRGMLTNMIKEESIMYKERRGCSPGERWTDRDEALRALARPSPGRIRAEAILVDELSEGHSSPDTHSILPGKRTLRFLTPERKKMTLKEKPNATVPNKVSIKLRGGATPTTVAEMREKLEWEIAARHEEQKRRQEAVRQLLCKEQLKETLEDRKELLKEKLEDRKKAKRTKSENTGSCKLAVQHSYTDRSETRHPHEPLQIAPQSVALPPKVESSSKSTTIHTVRELVSKRNEKFGPPPETRIQPFHSPLPYEPGPCCKRPLHPYLRNLGNPLPQHRPQPSLHMAVLSSNPKLTKGFTRNRIPMIPVPPPSKEHILERLSAVTQELGKYFPTEQGGTSGALQPTLSDFETTETETVDTEVSDSPIPEDEKIPRLQEIDAREAAHINSIPEAPTETEAETETQDETPKDFGDQLRKELKKFGITSSTNGISDTTYKSISSALEMQRSVRMSHFHGGERQIVEYERNSVVWHTQMAARDHGSVKPLVTDSGSDHSNAEDSVEESGKSDESGSESREAEMKAGGASGEGSSEQSSVVSESSGDTQDAPAPCKRKNVQWAKHSKNDGNAHLDSRSPPSRAFSWDPTANSSRSNREFPSRGESTRFIANQPRQPEEDELSFGLGDWDSDDDDTGKKR